MPPVINEELCTCCHKCVLICTEDVFFESVTGEIPVVKYPDVCFHCNCCIRECPEEGAIWLRIPLTMQVAYK